MFVTIITFIAILGLLIFVHELGHFFVSRKMGVKAEEFGLGFPPRIFGFVKVAGQWKFIRGKDKNEAGNEREYAKTIYSLNWVPLGGFVKIKGEAGELASDQDSFASRPLWQRGLILVSGVSMNFILAAFLLSVCFFVGVPQVIDGMDSKQSKAKDEKIQFIYIQKGSPAYEAGFEIGDVLVSANDQKFKEIKDFQGYIAANFGQELLIKVKRGQEIIKKTVKPEVVEFETEEENIVAKKAIGVALVKTGIVSYHFWEAIWQGIVTTIYLMKLIISAFYDLFKGLIVTHKVATDIAGPVGIAVATGQVVKLGFVYILQFAALLSINLGIINFLPFPALDGGRFAALGIEAIRRKPNNQRIEAIVHNVGFGVLMALVALVTYRDVVKFGGNLVGKFFGGWR